MKQKIALTLVLLMTVCSLVTVCAQPIAEQTKYYATDFNGASDFTTKSFDVAYTNRQAKNNALALKTPDYTVSGVTCVPIAVTNILGFYDRYYDALIPNFTAGTAYGEHFMYKYEDNNVKVAALQLAADMGLSDPSKQGATVAEAKAGLIKYCNNKARSVSFNSVMQNKVFNYDTAKAQLNSNKPIIIFCSVFNLVSLDVSNNQENVTLHVCDDPHAMAVFGYMEITYTLNNGSVRVDKYLAVASGLIEFPFGKIYMGSDIVIDDAYAVTIY